MSLIKPVQTRVFAVILFAALTAVALACGSDRPGSQPTVPPSVTPVASTPTPTPVVGNGTPGIPTPAPTNTPTAPEATPTSTQGELQAQLDSARARWSSFRPQFYQFDLTWHCFCAIAGKAIRLHVTGNEITSAIDIESGDPVELDSGRLVMTVDQMFDWIQTGLDSADKKVLSATFEHDAGNPISVTIDELVGATDTVLLGTVTNFRPGDRDPVLEQLQQDFNFAMSRWAEGGRLFDTGIQNYQFTFRWQCFCPPETNSLVKIEVEGNKIRSVVDAVTGLPVEAPGGLEYKTVLELFMWIRDRLWQNPDYAELEFDEQTGYPIRVWFDPLRIVADEEQGFELTDLEPLNIYPELTQEIEEARAKWAEQGWTDYSFDFNWSCFCVEEYVAPVTITVQNGVVTDVVYRDVGESVSFEFMDNFFTIVRLFDELEQLATADPGAMTAEFDPVSGVPTSAFIDYHEVFVDDEKGWNAGNVTRLD